MLAKCKHICICVNMYVYMLKYMRQVRTPSPQEGRVPRLARPPPPCKNGLVRSSPKVVGPLAPGHQMRETRKLGIEIRAGRPEF